MRDEQKEKMLLSMNLVDDKYIDEASPQKQNAPKKRFTKKFGIIAASIAVVVTALNVWLFTPFRATPPDVSMYADSEYYSIIQKLNTVTFSKPRYKNNFDKLISIIGAGFTPKAEASVNDGSTSGTNGDFIGSQNYQETTDNQVAGVIEADLIKRSDKYIYYLDGLKLRVFSIEGNESCEVGSYNLPASNYHDQYRFYLSEDCQTITFVIPSYTFIISDDSEKKQSVVTIASLDVSDPANIRKTAEFTITGGYLSSRMVDGELLLFTQFAVGMNPDFSDESKFLPQIKSENGFESLPLNAIISPDTLDTARYTVVSKLKEGSLELADCTALLSYSQEVYVSAENIFATRSYEEHNQSLLGTTSTTMTEITGLSYSGEQFSQLGTIAVPGRVKNQYSMDEYEGILRVVTTTSSSKEETNASLYCINLADWSIRAQVENFAPEGETAESVRFDGNAAYVCTAKVVVLTDPVYFFDLSDLDNITYKDTGTIEGYSTSLVNFRDGYLLGIGVGNTRDSLKIEIYEETAMGVQSVCAYELENVGYSEDYKSYYIDRENRMIGIGIICYMRDISDQEYNRYLLLSFDEYNLHEVINTRLLGQNEKKRGLLIDGYFYLFGDNDFKVVELNSNNQ